MKITVIIPFYSNKEWLEESIESVLKQTIKPDEVLVINDGSKESIDAIKSKYLNDITFIEQANQGAGAARNKGINCSTGDIIFFLDSDDVWLPNKIEKQVLFMKKNKYLWSATSYKTFGTSKSKVVTPYKSDELMWEHLYNASLIATPTVAVYRKAINEYGEFAPDMKKGQDIFLWFKLSNHIKLGVIDEPLTLVRMRSESTMKSFDAHIQVRGKLWEKMYIEKILYMPRRFLTKLGYRICYKIYRKSTEYNYIDKALFGLAWLIFRFDNMLLR